MSKTDRPHGAIIVPIISTLLAVLLILDGFLTTENPNSAIYKNWDDKIYLFSIVIGLILLVVANGIKKGKNLARWSICLLTIFGFLYGFSFLFGKAIYEVIHEITYFYSNVQMLVWLVLFLPLLFTKKARQYFRENS